MITVGVAFFSVFPTMRKHVLRRHSKARKSPGKLQNAVVVKQENLMGSKVGLIFAY